MAGRLNSEWHFGQSREGAITQSCALPVCWLFVLHQAALGGLELLTALSEAGWISQIILLARLLDKSPLHSMAVACWCKVLGSCSVCQLRCLKLCYPKLRKRLHTMQSSGRLSLLMQGAGIMHHLAAQAVRHPAPAQRVPRADAEHGRLPGEEAHGTSALQPRGCREVMPRPMPVAP